ncbi:MAG: hypothetical protein Tsb0013_06460 [Phycisphaerales bacterium]
MIDKLFATDALWFTVPALVGTGFFVIRLAMTMIGLDLEGAEGGGEDIPGVLDAGADIDEGMEHAESSSVFRFLSIQTVTAFAMGFGWGGLAAKYAMGLDTVPSVVVAIAFGGLFAWLIVWLLQLMYAMESSGNISIKSAYGAEGVTTSTIPAHDAGTGRVRITIEDRQRAYAARSLGDEIRMGAHIRVVRVNADNTVTVTPV